MPIIADSMAQTFEVMPNQLHLIICTVGNYAQKWVTKQYNY